MSSLESRINNLLAGQSFVISSFYNIVCSVERSCDGKTLRFVRTYPNGSFIVIKEVGISTK